MADFIPGTAIKRPEMVLADISPGVWILMATTLRVLRQAGAPGFVIRDYLYESKSVGTYDHVFQTTRQYVKLV